MNKLAVLYARVSSKEQEKEGFSIPAQLHLLRDYGARKDFQIVTEYTDVETAKISGRREFGKMLEFLKARPDVRVVLVEKTDRLYRNFKDYVAIEELSLEIHLVKEGEILAKESRSHLKFIHGIKVLMAKNYIDNLSEETRKGQIEKAQQGWYPSIAPLGYSNVEIDGKKVIVPDPEIAPIIKLLYEWYGSGHYSLSQVAKKAYETGLRYRGGQNRVHKSIIHKILTNPIYYGEFKWCGTMYNGLHEPIITKELFESVRRMLIEKGRRSAKQGKHVWAFQGLVSCGHCGCAMTAEMKKGRYVYYHCTGHRGKCPEKYVREETLGAQFGDALGQIQFDKSVLRWVSNELRNGHADEKAFHAEAAMRLQREYLKLQNRLDTMYVDKLDGKISEDTYRTKSDEWRKEQDGIQLQIAGHKSANRSFIEEGIRILELAQDAVRLYDMQEMGERRRLLDFVFSNSAWREGKLTPNYRQPFEMLAVANSTHGNKKAAFPMKNGQSEIWLLGPNSFRTLRISFQR